MAIAEVLAATHAWLSLLHEEEVKGAPDGKVLTAPSLDGALGVAHGLLHDRAIRVRVGAGREERRRERGRVVRRRGVERGHPFLVAVVHVRAVVDEQAQYVQRLVG